MQKAEKIKAASEEKKTAEEEKPVNKDAYFDEDDMQKAFTVKYSERNMKLLSVVAAKNKGKFIVSSEGANVHIKVRMFF